MKVQTLFTNTNNAQAFAEIILTAGRNQLQTKESVYHSIGLFIKFNHINIEFGFGSSHIWIKDNSGNEVKFLFS